MNPIAVYVLSGMLIEILYSIPLRVGGESSSLMGWIYSNLFLSWAQPINASLAFALFYVLFWCLIMHFFYRRGIFIKI